MTGVAVLATVIARTPPTMQEGNLVAYGPSAGARSGAHILEGFTPIVPRVAFYLPRTSATECSVAARIRRMAHLLAKTVFG